MTEERAIQILEQRACCRECVADCTCAECDEAFDMAIKALEQEPCEDDHDGCKDCVYQANPEDAMPCRECKHSYMDKWKAIPSAEPKTGHWIEEDIFDGDVAYRCSECNELFWLDDGTPKDNEYNFCPKCGKRLVEPQERSEE